MSVFAVNYIYGPDTETRLQVRPEHRNWLQSMVESGSILAAGAYGDDPGFGGLLIVSAADGQAAAELLTADPYAVAGVIAETTVRPWNPILGQLSES